MDNINYCVTVSYDGSDFHGWAKQPNNTTIQQTIEESLYTLLNKKIQIYASGRTDTYVHAIGQVFSFKTKKLKMTNKNFVDAINNILPRTIRVKSIKKVFNNFNARFSAKTKTYVYLVNPNQYDLFKDKYEYNYCKPINITKCKKAAKLLIGKHNFLSFSTSEINDTIRTIKSIQIKKNNNLVAFVITGNGFLRNMVRMIVGSLLDFNENKKSLEDFERLLKNPKKGSCITKAPGCGLYLYKVKY